ncbi:MAG: outer membrane lipoprotein carrier protein LolA [Alphaproteobacteria bacterium]|nr:MAG: outer membrane lipoprotein carrier protein LolA [Alphaproteobacteria bacterium]
MMYRRVKALGAALVFFSLTASAGSAENTVPNEHITGELREEINKVSDYINAISTLKGDFTQTNPDGTASLGKFYMRRPGRVRFEYEDPPMTLLSDGTWAMINDRSLESVDRYPLAETPLNLLLKRNVDLLKDADITKVEHANGLLAVTAEETTGVALGSLTLIFNEPALELRYWVVTDVNGESTVVMLKNIERGMKLDPALFLPEEGSVFGDDPFE